jgi:TM2 domain-containing membrane protein YozV
MTTWHYIRAGAIRDETIGPIDTETLAQRIRAGSVTPTTPLCSPEKTHNKWVTLQAFPPLVQIYQEGETARQLDRERQREATAEAKRLAKRDRALTKAAQARERVDRHAIRPVFPTPERPPVSPEPEYAPRAQVLAPSAPAGPVFAQAPQAGASIVNVTVHAPRERTNNAAAVLCSFLIPGLGQLTQGRVLAGMFWFGGSLLSVPLAFVLIGFVTGPLCWLGSMIDAAAYRGR